MDYIWQHKDWPNFNWDSETIDQNAYAWAREAGGLLGEVKHLPENQRSDAMIDLLVSEAVKTSQIEGENLDREDVRSSIRNQLGLNPTPEPVSDPRADGIAQMMLSVRENYTKPLTAKLLCAWQDMVIADPYARERIEVGRWRSTTEPMQIVSGAYGKETVHYEAPPAKHIPKEMTAFIRWFNNSKDIKAPIRAGIAHLYFECIHPFADGNGRVGRAIAEMALSQELGHPAIMSLSTTIQNKRKEYYKELNNASTKTPNISQWLTWFTQTILESQQQAHDQIAFILAKARFHTNYQDKLNERQHKIINRMLKEGPEGFTGGMNASKYAKITACAKATATRDLAQLLQMGAIKKLNGGGRSTRYELNLD